MIEFVKISLSFENGTIGIMSFVTDDGTTKQKVNEKNINEVIEKSNFESHVVLWRIIDENEIPKDREFRNAWIDDGTIKHDIEKVKKIHIDHLREKRAYLLTDLDVEFSRAQGKKDSKKADAVEAERERLRNLPAVLTQAMTSALTIDQVKEFTIDYGK